MTYREALRTLEDRQEARIRLGLDRIRRHLARLGDPQEASLSIHVAGTNGKGSVCAMLASILQANGLRTGLYTSPHLSGPRERIRVNGKPIPPSSFARAMERALKAEGPASRDRLTYFELLTSVAFQYFREMKTRIAVLETGLGGRFDATNVVRRPVAAVVTSIDYDHMDFLGPTLSSIAREKAGIIKRGVPAFTAETKPEALAVLQRVARRRGAPLTVVEPKLRSGWRTVRTDWSGGRQLLRGPGGKVLWLGLLGDAQPGNAALAMETMSAARARGLAVPRRAAERGLAQVRWPGRFEPVRRGPRTILLDGAHNVGALRRFQATLEASPWKRRSKEFILGILRDKQHESMIRVLAPLLKGQRVTLTRPPSPRALDPEQLGREVRRWAPSVVVRVDADPERAMRSAFREGPALTCVCGSFYLVGMARRVLGLPS